MPDSDLQIMTCPKCLAKFETEGSDQSGGQPSCPECGTKADTMRKTSLAENGGNSIPPLPAQKKSINIDLPEMIIQNANPKKRKDNPQNIPSARRQDIGNTPISQPALTRKYSRPANNWEADNKQEETPQSTSNADDANMRFRKPQRQHKHSAKPWFGFLLVAASLIIVSLTILPRSRKNSGPTDPQAQPPEEVITKVQKPVQAETLPAQEAPIISPIQQAIKKHGIRGIHKKASAAVRNFLEAKTLEERSGFTRSPQRVKPLMADYYKIHDPGPINYLSLTDQNDSSSMNKYYAIGVTLDDLSTAYAIVTIEEDHFLVDWEAFVGYSEMNLSKFMEQRPGSATLFRLRVKLDDYYNFNFTAEKYQCLQLTNMDQTTVIYGYVMKGPGLLSSLQADKAFFTLRLRYPEKSESANQVIIDEVITRGWVIE